MAGRGSLSLNEDREDAKVPAVTDSRRPALLRDPAVFQVLATFLVALAVLLRNPVPAFRPEFWAEDASEFFFDTLVLPDRGLLSPVYGYYFFLSRIIAFVASLLPLRLVPGVYAWTSLAFGAVALGWFVREGFQWLVAKRWLRLFLAILLTLVPGTQEVFYNLCNLPMLLAFWALLLLLERPDSPSWWRVAGLVVLTLSSAQMVLWTPIAAWLFFRTRNRRYVLVVAVMVGIGALNAVGSRTSAAQAHLLADGSLSTLPRLLVENAFLRLVPDPFLLPKTVVGLMRAPSYVFWTLAALSFAALCAVAIVSVRRNADFALLGLAYLGAIGYIGIAAVSRNYLGPFLLREQGNLLWHVRYSFLPAALALLIWSSLLLPRRPNRWLNIASVAAFVVMTLRLIVFVPSLYDRPDQHWSERAAYVGRILESHESTGRAAIVHLGMLPVHPLGWRPSNGRVLVELPGR
jgi:hypothetical protein